MFFDNNIQFEIKLNNIGGFFIDRYKEVWSVLYKINKKEDIKHNIINAGVLILNVSSELIVLVVSVFDIVAKKINIGDLQYNLNIVSRLREQLGGLMYDVNRFLVNNTRLNELQDFIAIKSEKEKSGT